MNVKNLQFVLYYLQCDGFNNYFEHILIQIVYFHFSSFWTCLQNFINHKLPPQTCTHLYYVIFNFHFKIQLLLTNLFLLPSTHHHSPIYIQSCKYYFIPPVFFTYFWKSSFNCSVSVFLTIFKFFISLFFLQFIQFFFLKVFASRS